MALAQAEQAEQAGQRRGGLRPPLHCWTSLAAGGAWPFATSPRLLPQPTPKGVTFHFFVLLWHRLLLLLVAAALPLVQPWSNAPQEASQPAKRSLRQYTAISTLLLLHPIDMHSDPPSFHPWTASLVGQPFHPLAHDHCTGQFVCDAQQGAVASGLWRSQRQLQGSVHAESCKVSQEFCASRSNKQGFAG